MPPKLGGVLGFSPKQKPTWPSCVRFVTDTVSGKKAGNKNTVTVVAEETQFASGDPGGSKRVAGFWPPCSGSFHVSSCEVPMRRTASELLRVSLRLDPESSRGPA